MLQSKGGTMPTEATDVVFVVETTPNFKPHFKDIKDTYIKPILEHFTDGLLLDSTVNWFGAANLPTLFCLLEYNNLYGPQENQIKFYEPTRDAYKFIEMIDNLRFVSQDAQIYSMLGEGLATALQVFEGLHEFRKGERNSKIERHCIVLTCSQPYQIPSQSSMGYHGFYPEQLAEMMAKKGINLSIIAPRTVPELQNLYNKGYSSETSLQTKPTSARKEHHMVLLRGFALKEKTQQQQPPKHEKQQQPMQPSIQSQEEASHQVNLQQPQQPAKQKIQEQQQQHKLQQQQQHLKQQLEERAKQQQKHLQLSKSNWGDLFQSWRLIVGAVVFIPLNNYNT